MAALDTHVRYRPAAPGGWWVASEGAAVAVLAPVVTETAITAVWRGVGDGGIGAVLESLTGAFGTSLAAIPPFALAVAEPGGVRVAVRGALTVVVEGAAPEEISGEGVATWTERFVADATRVTITPGRDAASGPLVPLRSGVGIADAVVVELGSVASVAHITPVASVAKSEIRTSAEPVAVVPPEVVQISEDVTPDAAEADAPAPEAADAAEADEAEAAATDAEADAVAPDAVEAPVSADTLLPVATSAPEVEHVDEYDLLWGETVARPIAAAATEATPAEPEAVPARGDEAVAPAEPEPQPEPRLEPDLAPPTPASGPLGDHDGETIAVADLRAMRDAQRERFESTDNVPPRAPARGRIRLSTGRIVELERPVVVGRRPQSTRTSGAQLPTLVAVDSPEQDISRSHVEIRAEGEHVLATDLDTTNGTVLLRGGQDPVRLHPGEPTMVVTGDVLDIGDGVTIAFEDLP